jgi:hypothetical protein
MKLEDVRKRKTDESVIVCGRVSYDTKKFIKKHNINIALLITKAVEEIKKEVKNK